MQGWRSPHSDTLDEVGNEPGCYNCTILVGDCGIDWKIAHVRAYHFKGELWAEQEELHTIGDEPPHNLRIDAERRVVNHHTPICIVECLVIIAGVERTNNLGIVCDVSLRL